MVRPYKVKGEKRKKKEENYDKEEIEESVDDESTGSAKRVKTQHTASDTEAAERVVDLLAGIPVVSTDQSTKPGVIFISTELPWKLLKLESGLSLRLKWWRSQVRNPLPAKARGLPFGSSSSHQACLVRVTSPMWFASYCIGAGVLPCAHPKVQLLQKLSITAVGFSHSSDKLVDIQDYVNGISNDMNLVFVVCSTVLVKFSMDNFNLWVGAMARGKIEKDDVEDYLSKFHSSFSIPLSSIYMAGLWSSGKIATLDMWVRHTVRGLSGV
ncbi:hypothetical protein KY285_027832 [Solanum tuberosum]|nr:hypothetical protein KY285_027832 [Solanum tuberosum]